jgi:hypothetical protein
MLDGASKEGQVLALAFEEGEEGEGWDAISAAFGIVGRGGGIDRLPRGYQEVRTGHIITGLVSLAFMEPDRTPDLPGSGQIEGCGESAASDWVHLAFCEVSRGGGGRGWGFLPTPSRVQGGDDWGGGDGSVRWWGRCCTTSLPKISCV